MNKDPGATERQHEKALGERTIAMSDYPGDEQWAMQQPHRVAHLPMPPKPHTTDAACRIAELRNEDLAGENRLLRERIASLESDNEVLTGLCRTLTLYVQEAQRCVYETKQQLDRSQVRNDRLRELTRLGVDS